MAASTGFDFPSNGQFVGDDKFAMPAWLQWIQRIHNIATASQQSGPTADRPTSGLWVGRIFYDTTLGYPVYVNSVKPAVWHNAAGVPC